MNAKEMIRLAVNEINIHAGYEKFVYSEESKFEPGNDYYKHEYIVSIEKDKMPWYKTRIPIRENGDSVEKEVVQCFETLIKKMIKESFVREEWVMTDGTDITTMFHNYMKNQSPEWIRFQVSILKDMLPKKHWWKRMFSK